MIMRFQEFYGATVIESTYGVIIKMQRGGYVYNQLLPIDVLFYECDKNALIIDTINLIEQKLKDI